LILATNLGIKDDSMIIVIMIVVVVVMSAFLIPILAYSQVPYLPNIQSPSYEKSQNSNNNDNSIASVSIYLNRNTNSSSSITSQSNNNNNDKFMIINFDDSHESEYTYAKPILDKYGFKATFFEVCNWVEAGYHDLDKSTTWEHIAALQQDGMDIEAHTMTHPDLNYRS
jgi:peptidoglycan/xylan/chitin deacetylase (PgdA/CDA1 family)